MNTKEAIAKRIVQLCEEKGIAINALANISGVSPSTVYSMLNEKSQNPGVVSLKKLQRTHVRAIRILCGQRVGTF